MAAPALVSVVIAVYNGEARLPQQLDALSHQEDPGPYEVVVVDNGSGDRSLSVAERYASVLPLRIVHDAVRQGQSYARNVGAAQAIGDFLCFCDQDDVVGARWVGTMRRAAARADAVAGWVETERLNPQSIRRWRNTPPSDGLVADDRTLPWAIGCNLGVWREAFTSVGGWDEQFVGGGEDVDLSWRLQLAGYRLEFSAESVVHYRHRPGLQALATQHRGYGASQLRLARRYHTVLPQPAPIRLAVRQLIWVAVRLPYAVLPDRYGILVREASRLQGEIVELLRRTPPDV